MSQGNSSVMTSSSSGSSSSSSATKIGELIKRMNETTIKSCVIGISELKLHFIHKDFVHTALLLTDQKRSKLTNKTEGILIEYGNYPPDDTEGKKKEEDYVKNEEVIYRYGIQTGGLRYYTNTYEKFIEIFCDVGYIQLNVHKNNQISFSNFIEEIAPISEKKWIKEKYNPLSLNCQIFTCHSIDIMKPSYEKISIRKGKNSQNVSDEKIESIPPSNVLKTLKKYENEDE